MAGKIQLTQTRILEWYERYEGKVYISFSGGKDSTVLLDLARRIYPDIPAVFADTGLEYPEIRSFVKTVDNVTFVRPKTTFRDVLERYGYPVVGKEQSFRVRKLRHQNLTFDYRQKQMARLGKWSILLNASFECSEQCCEYTKKKPIVEYEKQTQRRGILGTMTSESYQRELLWLKDGCNAFDNKRPLSKPMSFWTNQDVLQYLKLTGIPYSSVYGEIVPASNQLSLFEEETAQLRTTGCERTGCMFCCFGITHGGEPNRFQRMKQTHPHLYEYCIGGGIYDSNGMLKPDKHGLGIGKILDYINVPY